MAIDKRLQIYDEQGNEVDYDILANDVKFLPDGKDLPTKLAEMEEEIGEGGYTPPVGGIPKSDLASDVQTSLGKADTALQQSDKTQLQTAITSLQNALNTLIGSGNVQGAIDTFNEVKAFLDGIDTSDPTLANQLLALNNAITVLQNTLSAKANSGDIPTKVSELENDEGYITASEVSGIVAASGDMAIVETSDYIDILIYSAEIGITPSAVSLHASGKSQTIKVSGSHLKADININVPTGFTATPSTIQHVGGVVAETDVVIAYTGADASAASGSITATSGDVTKSIPVAYTQYAGPTIIADDAAIAFNAGAGTTQQKSLVVQGVNLTDGITAAISGTNAGKFSVSPASISQSGGTASGTLSITYTPAAGDTGTHTATLTLSSSGATSKVITLNGAVSSLTVSKQTMTFNTDQGVAVTDTFTVEGANLNEGITIAASGTGFSVSPQTIAHNNGMVASTSVTVTYSPSAAGMNTGTITIQSSGVTKTITLSGTAEEIPEATSANEYKFQKGGIYYMVQSVDGVLTDTVGVYNSTYNTSSKPSSNPYSGDIVIPSTVKAIVDGVTKTLDVVKVAAYAFAKCDGLVSLVIPDSVTTLGNAFLQSSSINFKSLIIGNGATSLPSYISMRGKGLTYIELGENISSFSGTQVYIYLGSTSTMVLKYNGTVTLNNNSIMSLTEGNPTDATLKVPSSLVDTYKSAKNWGVVNNYGWHAFNPENITAIDE